MQLMYYHRWQVILVLMPYLCLKLKYEIQSKPKLMMILLRRKSVNKQPNIQTFLTVELSVGLSQNQVVVPPYSNLI